MRVKMNSIHSFSNRWMAERTASVLILSLLVMTVLIILAAVFIIRAVNAYHTAKRNAMAAAAAYAAEAGTEAGLDIIDTLINTHMRQTISAVDPSVLSNSAQSYTNDQDGIGFLMISVMDQGSPLLTLNGTQAEYDVGPVNMPAGGTYQLHIIFTEQKDPVAVGPDQWDFSYFFMVQATGTVDDATSKMAVHGDFTVRVQRDNFAKYALFTNEQRTPSGSVVWFTDKTNFAGPVHTNDRFNFALNPSGTFEDLVTQVQQKARFYNSGSPVLLDADANGNKDVPVFLNGFQRGVSAVTLSSSATQQGMINQALGSESISGPGIYVPNNGTAVNGGIYVEGDANISLNVDANDRPVYTIQQGSTVKTITVDYTNQQTIVSSGAGEPQVYQGLPDGVDNVGTLIYVNGSVTGLGGTVQKDTQVTIASDQHIVINNHVMYENYTQAQGTPGDPNYVPPSAEGTTNVLGLVSWNGNVSIDQSAPNDINIHATVMARNGIFYVEDYNNWWVGPRGTATVLGGVITDQYGAFGLFNGSTGQMISGYGRNFVYDRRMATGTAPPYFPTLETFIAFTNDITDSLTWVTNDF